MLTLSINLCVSLLAACTRSLIGLLHHSGLIVWEPHPPCPSTPRTRFLSFDSTWTTGCSSCYKLSQWSDGLFCSGCWLSEGFRKSLKKVPGGCRTARSLHEMHIYQFVCFFTHVNIKMWMIKLLHLIMCAAFILANNRKGTEYTSVVIFRMF